MAIRLDAWARGLLLAAVLLASGAASALNPPQSYAGVVCDAQSNPGPDDIRQGAGVFSVACDHSGTSTWPPPGGDWQAGAQARTGYTVTEAGSGIGIAHSTSSVIVNGVLSGPVDVVAGAYIRYEVAFQTLAAPAFTPPKIAILYSAAGEAQLSGAEGGFFNIFSTLGVDDFPYASFQRNSHDGSTFGAYASSVTLWVAPDAVAQAFVNATCNVSRFSAGRGECRANADPRISFDQAAFDAFYGARSFDLASAYRMTFSAPVPEPSPLLHWLGGLPLLLSVAGWRRMRKH